MTYLLQPEEADLPKDDTALGEHIRAAGPQERYSKSSKLYSLLRKQVENKSFANIRLPIKLLKPIIPKENIWARPTAVKMQLGLKKRWWATTLDRVLPPIPEEEWNRLRDLATGQLQFESPPPRRSRRGQAQEPNLLQFLRMPHKPQLTGVEELKFDAEEGFIPVLVERPNDYSTMPQRSLRRMYAKIWNQSPLIEKNQATGYWDVKWGGWVSPSLSGIVAPATSEHEELFEGTDVHESKKPKIKQRKRMKPVPA